MFFVKADVTFWVAHGGATVTCDKFVFNTLQHSDYFLTSVVKIRVKEGVSGSWWPCRAACPYVSVLACNLDTLNNWNKYKLPPWFLRSVYLLLGVGFRWMYGLRNGLHQSHTLCLGDWQGQSNSWSIHEHNLNHLSPWGTASWYQQISNQMSFSLSSEPPEGEVSFNYSTAVFGLMS